MNLQLNKEIEGVVALPHLGVIRAQGEEAVKFLQAQLTQDFALIDPSLARLAAFCSAKGRMQASFIGVKRSETEVLLICSKDLLAATLKRLSMFVMRAKAKLSDASADFTLYGLAGTAAQQGLGRASPPWRKIEQGEVSIVSLYPADGVNRALWLAPSTEPAPLGQALRYADWLWSEVRSGVATVSAPIVEAFVPQMLNYESLGGVNFKKGCYPGQEVVARSQFRGVLKRRTYLAHCAQALQASDELFELNDPSQPCGIVVQAAESPFGGFDALISIQTSAAQGQLHLGAMSGPELVLQTLPYPLLEDI
ncbi:MAG: folate-binding protein [Burkholderiaceae bacterium]